MLRIFPFIFSLLAPIGLLAVTANAQIPDAAALFEEHCASCHLADVIPRALAIDNMRAMPPEAIIAALTNGPMQQQGMELNVEERQLLAEYITGRAIDAAPNAAFGACAPALSAGWPGLDQGPQWNGWGGSLATHPSYEPDATWPGRHRRDGRNFGRRHSSFFCSCASMSERGLAGS